jgi:hypothetical protein
MKRQLILALAALVVAGFLAPAAEAARRIRATISLDGKPILESSHGDNGHPDADEVWGYLKELTFEPLQAFPAPEGHAKEFTLTSNPPPGELGRIVIDVDYGGETRIRELKLLRVPRDKYGREWKLDPAAVDALFDGRLISRRDAARLAKPQRSGP